MVILVFIAILAVAGLVASLPSIRRSQGVETIRLKIIVSYSGHWNGNYSYGSPCPGSAVVPWSGTGAMNENVTFQGNINNGLGYSVHVQKQDDSKEVLRVTVVSDAGLSYNNSTSVAFGAVGFVVCSIS